MPLIMFIHKNVGVLLNNGMSIDDNNMDFEIIDDNGVDIELVE